MVLKAQQPSASLEGLLKHRLLGSNHPPLSLVWGLRTYISNTFPGMLTVHTLRTPEVESPSTSQQGLEDLSFLWPAALGPVLMFDPE